MCGCQQCDLGGRQPVVRVMSGVTADTATSNRSRLGSEPAIARYRAAREKDTWAVDHEKY